MTFPKFESQNQLIEFDPKNAEAIWEDISEFKKNYPQGRLATVIVKDMNWYYNEWGNEQTDDALCAVLGVLRQNKSDLEGFGYRRFGRWLVGFYNDEVKDRIAQGIQDLEIQSDGLQPTTVPLTERTIKLNPAKVEVEIKYVELNSIDHLFRKKE